MGFTTRNNLITEEEVEKFEYLIGEKLPKYYIFDDSLELYPLANNFNMFINQLKEDSEKW